MTVIRIWSPASSRSTPEQFGRRVPLLVRQVARRSTWKVSWVNVPENCTDPQPAVSASGTVTVPVGEPNAALQLVPVWTLVAWTYPPLFCRLMDDSKVGDAPAGALPVSFSATEKMARRRLVSPAWKPPSPARCTTGLVVGCSKPIVTVPRFTQ